ncbi:MAG: peptidylprolyl isomerase [Actinobacteria bacterium]|nr:peptidylprolyl isomerase [Actinomycetota bacterium]
MKRFIGVVSIVIVAAVSATPAHAAQKTSEIKCTSTKAIGHTPKVVAPAAKSLSKYPRTFTLETNCGNIVISLKPSKAPITITQLTTLARSGYFDNSLCHRLTTLGIYVLQCGDPTATGRGGPNFNYADENLPDPVKNNYPEGIVAMANSGPDTNGSQFFLVYGKTTLEPNYTIWGKITKGLDIIKAVAKAGVMGGGVDGSPAQSFVINKIIIN